jgi:ribonuclease HI
MAKKKKYYVVWEGRRKGIFENWDDCKKQVDKFEGAKYKSFETRYAAEQALKGHSTAYIGSSNVKPAQSSAQLKTFGNPISDSISVDGAWNTATGMSEYQGVHTATKKKLFHKGPFEEGTNNTMEFLALVHALAYCQKHNLDQPVYSDSRTAISWVKNKNARTKLKRTKKNEPIFDLLLRAIEWLHSNTYKNKILKWETKAWGENPADFGRK